MASERCRWRKSKLGLAQVTITIFVQGCKVCSEFRLACCGNGWPKGRRGRGRGLGDIGGGTAAAFGAAFGSRRAQQEHDDRPPHARRCDVRRE